MDWIGWQGKKVKIVLKDGYTKYGTFIGADANFVEIEYSNSSITRERIAIPTIVSIKEGVIR